MPLLGSLTAAVVPVAGLSLADRAAMWALMVRYYEGVREEMFAADLEEKPWVIVLRDGMDGPIVGFSTQMLLEAPVEGRNICALFSGDTIVDEAHWGHNPLAGAWGRFALSIIDAHAGSELYWYLISKGYRTYRYLPLFFRNFWPSRGETTPPAPAAVIRALAEQKFGQAFDAASGVVRATPESCRLRAGVAEVTSQRRRHPDIAFFEERNSGHARGDELCCLAPLTRDNFTPAAWRVMGLEPRAVSQRWDDSPEPTAAVPRMVAP